VSDILVDIRAFMRSFDPPPARELHCGQAVWDTLRELTPQDNAPPDLGAALGSAPLYGIPVHVDPDMPAGRWELREDGRVAHSGDITPEPGAFYVPGIGWLAISLPSEDLP
jgi:hypothetical protein